MSKLIERIEGGLLSYGNEFTIQNNPFECNFDKFLSTDTDHTYIGKNSLEKIKNEGVKKLKAFYLTVSLSPCAKPFPVLSKKVKIGQITSGIYNPRIKKIQVCQ